MSAPHVCHVFSTFARGGPQVRTATILNALGTEYRHTIVALDGRIEAADQLQAHVDARVVATDPASRGLVDLTRLLGGLDPDLVVTYNWGAIEALAAARLCALPVIHAEDGFNPDEAEGQKLRRVLARRALLRGIEAVVVPSLVLRTIATRDWHVDPRRLVHIPNAVDCSHFRPGRADELRTHLGVAPHETLIGTVGHLSGSKNVGLLLRAAAPFAESQNVRILVVGDGPQRVELEEEARRLGIAERLLLVGAIPDPAEHLRALDIFALTSRTEQMPLAVLEAMATGLAVVATDVGDVRHMVSPCNRPFVMPADDATGISVALDTLRRRAGVRATLGQKNRDRCIECYDLRTMIGCYHDLWHDAIAGAMAGGLRRPA